MTQSFIGEKWEKVHFDFEFTNQFELHISNFGRVKSHTKLHDGKILNGSITHGYRQISLRLFKPRTLAEEKKLAFYKKQISQLTTSITLTKRRLKEKVKRDNIRNGYVQKIKQDTELLIGLKNNYRKEFNRIELKRTVNKYFFIHRLVAEYFCQKKSDSQQIVIHLDHSKTNNKWNNLKWCSQEEVTIHHKHSPSVNAIKGIRKGKRVENASHYKLSENRVMIIKKRILEGRKLSDLSKQFKVSETQLLRIKRGINWGNVAAAN